MLPNPDMRPEDGAKYLIEKGASKSSGGHVLSRMTLLEKIFTDTLEAIAFRSFDWISIAVFQNPKVPDAADARRMAEVKGTSLSE